ncbi:MAG: 50S ribosomal protein L25/general stress protein Ctc [Gammaproteobacteria bacterium]|nr:50S ribosomal protein L25/general stress protein Ctc [Gammaproteobacteria bacterium]MDH3446548.1 50S ribosomal protein L25/general stress protein Ctc [Gammaproteobacteria bacterium]
MSDLIHLNAELRSDSGKGASRRLRHQGMVPAIVYGGERDPAMISIAHNEFIHELENESIYTQVIELRVGDRKQEVILRDLQRHPFKNKVLHADFYRIDQNKPIHITVPIHVENAETCVGVKQDGGMLTQLVSEIEILALPKNLPEYLSVDAANLHLGEILHLTDILMPEGVQLVTLAHIDVEDEEEFDQHNIGVLSVVKTREERIDEEAPEAPEVEVGGEGEVAEGGAGEAEGEAGDED